VHAQHDRLQGLLGEVEGIRAEVRKEVAGTRSAGGRRERAGSARCAPRERERGSPRERGEPPGHMAREQRPPRKGPLAARVARRTTASSAQEAAGSDEEYAGLQPRVLPKRGGGRGEARRDDPKAAALAEDLRRPRDSGWPV
jgi:hypothetical protein